MSTAVQINPLTLVSDVPTIINNMTLRPKNIDGSGAIQDATFMFIYNYQLPVCASCGRPIMPNEESVITAMF
jgi:hypothetical protein